VGCGIVCIVPIFVGGSWVDGVIEPRVSSLARRRSRWAGAVLVVAIVSAGCQSASSIISPAPARSSESITASLPVQPSSPAPRSVSPPGPAQPVGTPAGAVPARRELPRGGVRIVPRLRVVAFYGGPDGPGLGVLGAGSPEQAAAAVIARAAGFAGFGRPVQPAMELLATVAQGAPGPDGTYSRPVTNTQIAAYLAVAHEHRMLLILDIQPGGGEFLPQVRALEPFLLDPDVSVALDPEWKVPFEQAPGGGRIGSATAADINAVGAYLSGLITTRRLPDKLLIVHEFTRRCCPTVIRSSPTPGSRRPCTPMGREPRPVRSRFITSLHSRPGFMPDSRCSSPRTPD